MTVTVATIRAIFPQFADATVTPDARITYWLGYAARNISAEAWGESYDDGITLMTAHFLTRSLVNQAAIAEGQTPGLTTGIDTSQSGGGLSYSTNLDIVTEKGGGQWNLTEYGVQYYQLSQLMGLGGTVVAGVDPRLDPGAGTGAGGYGFGFGYGGW